MSNEIGEPKSDSGGGTLSQQGILISLGFVVAGVILGAVFAKENAVQIIGFGSMICVALITLLNQLHANANQAKEAKKTSEKVEEVKEALGVSDERTSNDMGALKQEVIEAKKTGEAVHVLVNSAYSAQLRVAMVALRRVADLTKNPEDITAAEIATKAFNEHEEKQRKVDTTIGPIPPPPAPAASEPARVVVVNDQGSPANVKLTPGAKPK